MKSMTGFAKRQCSTPTLKMTVEIKTLNSKTLDIITKLPSSLRSRDLDIRSLMTPLQRGKVDIIITEEVTASSAPCLNQELAIARYQQLRQLADTLGLDTSNILPVVVGQSDVWNTPETSDEITPDDWECLASTIREAVQEVDIFRQHEGGILQQDITLHVDNIEQRLQAIPPYEAERIETAKERIRHYLSESAIKDVDANRFEQELIYYLEKLDITEEKIRLAKHIDYFRHTLLHEEGSGKKLGFIVQEMGREINTTGSKANHVEIQKLVVEMKDELEKIKEQLGNIL